MITEVVASSHQAPQSMLLVAFNSLLQFFREVAQTVPEGSGFSAWGLGFRGF